MLFARALFAFLALPGLVAFAGPLMLFARGGREPIVQRGGLALLAFGTAGLLWCVRDFYVAGRGTLAPWSPPKNLVVVGLYRYSRNPMYLSVVLILTGWTVCYGSVGLLTYTVIMALLFHLRVMTGEEPWLARTHGVQWDTYKARVPRWLGF